MKNKFLLCLFLLSFTVVTVAQTVNSGEVVVHQGTIFSTTAAFNNTPEGTFINDGDVYAYSHWNNDGVVDHNDSGLTRFVGVLPQAISGSAINYLYNVVFDNASAVQPAFELSGDLSIANESDFNIGIIDNDNYGGSFIFEQFADHIGTSDDGHVDGPVIKVGDTSFEYPIGDSGYFRFAGISAPDLETDIFTGKYFFEDTNINYPVANLGPNLVLIDTAEHWTIERSTGEAEVLVTLSWNTNTTPVEILAAPLDAIHIARWDDTLQLWVDEGGLVDTINQTVTTAVDTYGVFTLARIEAREILPCGLSVLNLITPNGDDINDYFGVETPTGDTSCVNNIAVKIFNRWGVKVFESDNYGTNGDIFRGYSEGRATIAKNEKLPTGTYFYILTVDFLNSNNTIQVYKESDYLYINGN